MYVYGDVDHESRALYILSKCSITELSTQAPNISLNRLNIKYKGGTNILSKSSPECTAKIY